jgi:outer membrane protein assembly factor BamB
MSTSTFTTAGAARIGSVLLLAHIVFTIPAAQAQPRVKRVFSNLTPAVQDFFGASVDLDGGYALFGAPGDDTHASDAGRAFLYNAASGDLLHSFSDPNPAASRGFGNAVAISNNFVVIGAPDNSFQTPGRAFVFDAVTGSLLHTLDNPEPTPGEGFGWNVAIDGNDVLIGAYLDDSVVNNGGQAFMFDATTGTLIRTIRNPAPAVNDVFGIEVAIDGNTVAISASGDSTTASSAGQVSIFDRDTGNLRRTINNPTPGIFDRFGNSVAISGGKIIVGEVRDDTDGIDDGIAHVFDAVSGDRLRTFRDPSPSEIVELFGKAVEISGDDVFVGTDPNISGFDQHGRVFHFDAITGAVLHIFEDPTITTYYSAFGSEIVVDGNQLLISAPGIPSGPDGPGQVILYDLSVPEPQAALLAVIAIVLGIGHRRVRG